MSTSLYDTFGNEINFAFNQGILTQYIKNSTIRFPLPEAAATILNDLVNTPNASINPTEYESVKGRLVDSGFNEPTANTLAVVLIMIAQRQGVSAHEYFEANSASVRLVADAYDAINSMRPAGNLVGLVNTPKNGESKASNLIQP